MILGVYKWLNGIRTRINFKQDGSFVQDDRPRLIYPENDFRMEYQGFVKDNLMHGPGTLILKDKEELHFKGNWEKGKCT